MSGTSEPTPGDYGVPTVEDYPQLRPGPDGAVGVVGALAAVMGELPNIGKGDKSPEGYAYRGIEAITRHVQQLLAKHGVVVMPSAEVLRVVPSPAMKDGWQDVVMRVRWALFHKDGSSLTATTNGVGRDRSDKGANKAQTQAFKYLLIPALCIADGKDDSDGQSYEQDRRPDREAATADQVGEFHEAVGRLSDDDKAELKAWFAAERIGKVERATKDEAARAIAEAHRLIVRASTQPPVAEAPEVEQEPAQGHLVGAS